MRPLPAWKRRALACAPTTPTISERLTLDSCRLQERLLPFALRFMSLIPLPERSLLLGTLLTPITTASSARRFHLTELAVVIGVSRVPRSNDLSGSGKIGRAHV